MFIHRLLNRVRRDALAFSHRLNSNTVEAILSAAGLLLIFLFVLANAGGPYYLGRALLPFAGEAQALMEEVYEGILLARKHNLHEVGIGQSWENAYRYQRLTEGLYPIRVVRSDLPSEFVLVSPGASVPAACTLVDQKEHAHLLRCSLR